MMDSLRKPLVIISPEREVESEINAEVIFEKGKSRTEEILQMLQSHRSVATIIV